MRINSILFKSDSFGVEIENNEIYKLHKDKLMIIIILLILKIIV